MNIAVHESATPAFLRERVIAALRERRVHPYLIYSGARQSSLWTKLHHALSPVQRDEDCARLYDAAFRRSYEALRGNVVHLVSLACGDGTKDLRCLRQMRESGRAVLYSPADLSFELAVSASRNVAEGLRGVQSSPLVCDLERCSVLPAILKSFDPSGAERVVLFLGTIHNFWPPEILKTVMYPVRSQDRLLIGANLAPADSYDATLQKILAQYDNSPTRAWLMGALSELQLSNADGELVFRLANTSVPTLKRIEAVFVLGRDRNVALFGEEIRLVSGAELMVFFSHRFTPAHIQYFTEEAGLALIDSWVDESGQEGLFLCRRAG